MRLFTLPYVSEMKLVTFLVVSILFDYGATLSCLTTGSNQDFTKRRKALESIESYLSKTVSTLQSQINTINGKLKTLDKDLIAAEEDFKGRFSLFYFKIGI